MSDIKSVTPIANQTDMLAACNSAAAKARLFQWSQRDLEDVFDIDVLAQILPIGQLSIINHAVLTAYAEGFKASLVRSIRQIECEFVYRSSMGVLFSTKVGVSDRKHFSSMTMKERETATTGYAWLSTGTSFSTFTREAAFKEAA